MAAAVEKLDWDQIDTVLLDLDGTLLDLGFDNDFWLDFIPTVYAASQALTVEQAKAVLTPRFRACEGTMNWYCIDYWSRELGLNIEALKRTQAARIGWLPGAEDFLKRLRDLGKRLVLLTNSHPQVLKLKDEQTGVTRYLDVAISSHVFKVPKESEHFWTAVREVEPFDSQRSLFVDDSPPVLRAAQAAGIKWIRGVRRSSAARGGQGRPARDYAPDRDFGSIQAVDSVSDLDPGLPWTEGHRGGLEEGAGQDPGPDSLPT
jgi:putative hydrolase of the HAD superfamily